MSRQIILYSTGCKRCELVKRMLDVHDVDYMEVNDMDAMLDKGFESWPILEVDGKIMEYGAILTWLEQNNYYSLWKEDDNDSNFV